MKPAIFCYSTANLGDEVQSVAALSLLGLGVDQVALFDRDTHARCGLADEAENLFLIANGWYIHGKIPFPDFVHPLFIAVHLAPGWIVRHPEAFDYFKQYEPIGCRDVYTMKILRENGVKAYLSYCLTLSLNAEAFRNSELEIWERETLLVDVPNALFKQIRSLFPFAALETHQLSVPYTQGGESLYKERISLAEQCLRRYANAKMVVTNRVHVALPCLGLGTPCHFIPNIPFDVRYSGYDAPLNLIPKNPPSIPSPLQGLMPTRHLQSRILSEIEPLSFPGLAPIRHLQSLVIRLSVLHQENIMKYVPEMDDLALILSTLESIEKHGLP